MLKSRPCKICQSTFHTAMWHKPKKAISRFGKEARRYEEFRREVAYPYLVSKDGEVCSNCGRKGVLLDVDHIKKRSTNPELKYDLSNLQLLCRLCHLRKDI